MTYNLRQQLEEFTSGQCSALVFTHGLAAYCRAEPEEAWTALALIDQYYRRGKISAEVYRTVTHHIKRQALGRQSPGAGCKLKEAPSADRYVDTELTVPGMLGELEMQRRAKARSQGAGEVPEVNSELARARGEVQRYQNCLAMLARIDRRNRGALATALQDLKVARTQAADYLEQLKRDLSRRYVGTSGAGQSDAPAVRSDGYERPWQARLPLAVSLVALVLSMGAPPVL